MSIASWSLIVLSYSTDRHFGKDVIANNIQASPDDPQVHTLWLKLYKVRGHFLILKPRPTVPIYKKEFIEAIDATDNGISQYPTDIKPKYRSSTDLSSRVGALNPVWNQPADSDTIDVSRQLLSLWTSLNPFFRPYLHRLPSLPGRNFWQNWSSTPMLGSRPGTSSFRQSRRARHPSTPPAKSFSSSNSFPGR